MNRVTASLNRRALLFLSPVSSRSGQCSHRMLDATEQEVRLVATRKVGLSVADALKQHSVYVALVSCAKESLWLTFSRTAPPSHRLPSTAPSRSPPSPKPSPCPPRPTRSSLRRLLATSPRRQSSSCRPRRSASNARRRPSQTVTTRRRSPTAPASRSHPLAGLSGRGSLRRSPQTTTKTRISSRPTR